MRFFDTSVLVYSQDRRETGKQAIARALVREAIAAGEFIFSTQVMQEFYSVATRKKLLSPAQATALLAVWALNPVVTASADLWFRAFALQQSRELSVWDALIVQAAVEGGCTVIYSEDLQHGAQFGPLAVTNPFLYPPAVHEPAAKYRARARRAGP